MNGTMTEKITFYFRLFAVAAVIFLVAALIIYLARHGVFMKIKTWSRTTKTGNTTRRIWNVLLFALAIMFIGYFIYTGAHV